jgi:hypothetical protein
LASDVSLDGLASPWIPATRPALEVLALRQDPAYVSLLCESALKTAVPCPDGFGIKF